MNTDGLLVRGSGNAPTTSATKMSGTIANITTIQASDRSTNRFMDENHTMPASLDE
jgi:hypothetical protein